jgi:O-antigen/teichoic acid export membrane protein
VASLETEEGEPLGEEAAKPGGVDPPATRVRASLGRFMPTSWALVSRILGLGASTLVAMLLSRSLGPEQFGRFAVVTSIAIGSSLAATGGQNRLILRDLAAALAHDHRDVARDVLRGGFRALCLWVPMGMGAAGAATWMILGPSLATIALAAALAAALGLLLVASDVLRPLGEYRVANLASGQSGGTLVAFGLAALAIWTFTRPVTADGALLLNLLAAAWALIIALVTLVRRSRSRVGRSSNGRESRATRAMALAGVPFVVAQVAMFLTGQVDLWIAGSLLDEVDTGLYAAALRLMNIVRIPLNAAQLTLVAVIPALFTLGRLGPLEFRMRRAATLATAPAMVALVPCVLFPGPVIALVFGSDYRAAAPVLIALALGQLVNVLTGLCGIALSLCGQQRAVLVFAVVSALTATVANYLAASLWGLEALAVASASVSGGGFVVLWWLAKKRLGIWTHPLWPSVSNLRPSPEAPPASSSMGS